MQRNPRFPITNAAEIEFLRFWTEFMDKHDLTMIEFIDLLGEHQQSLIRSVLRVEWEEAKRELRGSESGRQEDGGGRPSS